MNQYTIGAFADHAAAETAVTRVHTELGVPEADISYMYKNAADTVTHVDATGADTTPAEGAASGAAIGGVIGAGIGLATIAGIIPVIGPLLAAGPLVAALGIGGAAGTTAAGAVTGAAAGGIIGALTSIGIDEKEATVYQERIVRGDALIAIRADSAIDVARVLKESGATDVNSYTTA